MKNVRNFVRAKLPWLVRLHRYGRDKRQLKHTVNRQTPFGFSLLGGNDLAAGFHEPTEAAMVDHCLVDTDVVIDVGANSGFYTCLAAKRGKHVLAVEPMPANLRYLFHNIRQNDFTPYVEVYPVAVSDGVGVLPMYGRGVTSSLVKGWADQTQHDGMVVPVNTLDNLFGRRFPGQSILLKVDVEGAEWQVLQGAQELLRRCSFLLLELSLKTNHAGGINDRFLDTFNLLWDLGFEGKTVSEEPAAVTRDMVLGWMADQHTDTVRDNFLFTNVALHRRFLSSKKVEAEGTNYLAAPQR